MATDLTLREHQLVAEAYAAGRRDALHEARAGAVSLGRPSRDGGKFEEWLVVPVSHLWQIAAQDEEQLR